LGVAINRAKGSNPSEFSAAKRLGHQQLENGQQCLLPESGSEDVTPEMGLCVATALWIQHIRREEYSGDMPSSAD